MPDNFALIAATVTFNAGLRGADAITAIVHAYGNLNAYTTIDDFFAASRAVQIVERSARVTLLRVRANIDAQLARLDS